MSFKYYLSNEQGNKDECETASNSVIIIGANGSGKSKLGAWIERQSHIKIRTFLGHFLL